MHLARRIRRALTIAIPGLLVIVGCTMIGDQITGIRAQKTDLNSCVKDCNDSYKLLYAEEQKRHLAAVEACQALEQPGKAACLETETAMHESNKEALSQGKIDCQNNCHRQGSGSGG